MTTVLDDVLTAEKAADATITEAKATATREIHEAVSTQHELLAAEAATLAEKRVTEFAQHQQELEKIVNQTHVQSEAEVAAVADTYQKKHSELVTLVTSLLA